VMGLSTQVFTRLHGAFPTLGHWIVVRWLAQPLRTRFGS
jgi:hypothetical protein